MLNSVLTLLARWTVGKKALGAVAWVSDKANGKKSEIILGLLGLVYALKLVGVLPVPVAEGVEQTLLTLLPVALADRASKVMKTVGGVLPKK